MSVRIAAKRLYKKVGEGPYWEASSNSIFSVEQLENVIHRYNTITGRMETRKMEKNASIIIPSDKGGYIITQDNQLCHYNWDTNIVKPLHGVEGDLSTVFNDGKCDVSGRLWAGTIKKVTAQDQPDGICSVYSLENDGTITKRIPGITLSNGLAWSLDNRIMYHVDTAVRSLFAYDFNLITGETKNKRVVKKFERKLFPDGMAMDAEGKLWIAFFGSGTVKCVDPESGVIMQEVHLPDAPCVTSCCFGGKDLTDLYVTTSAVVWPQLTQFGENGGSLFCVSGLGVKGQPVGGYGYDMSKI